MTPVGIVEGRGSGVRGRAAVVVVAAAAVRVVSLPLGSGAAGTEGSAGLLSPGRVDGGGGESASA